MSPERVVATYAGIHAIRRDRASESPAGLAVTTDRGALLG